LRNRKVLSLDWKNDGVMDDNSGDDIDDIHLRKCSSFHQIYTTGTYRLGFRPHIQQISLKRLTSSNRYVTLKLIGYFVK